MDRTRRKLLIVLAVGATGIAGYARWKGAGDECGSALSSLEGVELRAAREIGFARLEQLDGTPDADELCEALLDAIGDEASPQRLREAVARDFDSDRVEFVNGWAFARVELDLCVLEALSAPLGRLTPGWL